ncbi:hypothetical protein L195_g045300 [Trifolium pratense]|uniref:Uncharacterized protein n=1 Tax=Trifolium pratense TaxID=57577 RepID=A0A2K3MEG8_TRIPR|nr:hypothetical protein L195_g045300 [Trifolium pratense]
MREIRQLIQALMASGEIPQGSRPYLTVQQDNNQTLVVEESVHVAFDESYLEKNRKGSFVFDVSSILTKEIFEDCTHNDARKLNKKPLQKLVTVGLSQETTP